MQRWIVIGGVLAMLLLGGGAYGYWHHRQNLPAPMWVPLPVRGEFPVDERDQTIKELNSKLHDPELIRQVVKDQRLIEKWHLESQSEAEQELAGRIFVRMGDMKSPMGTVPAVHIGVTGKVREKEISSQIAVRLMKDVWKILGIEPPPRK